MIKYFLNRVQSPGALTDQRTPKEKENDYRFEELVASAEPVKWIEKTEWKKYPVSDQDGSGSCVAQSLALMLGIHQEINNEQFIPFSATHIYQRRQNRPSAGMWGVDAFNIAQQGVTLEQLVPSQNMTDAQMDSMTIQKYMEDVARIFNIGQYVLNPIGSLENVASIIQRTGKPVMVWYRFDYNEWTDIPQIRTNNPQLHHSVVAVDFTLYKGKKYLVIQDSWGQFGKWKGYRLISEDFHQKRNSFSAHFMNFRYIDGELKKPKFIEGDVVSLQNCLKHYGTFPTNIESTGFMGGITWKALRDFQVQEGLHPTGVNNLGPLTIKRLKELY